MIPEPVLPAILLTIDDPLVFSLVTFKGQAINLSGLSPIGLGFSISHCFNLNIERNSISLLEPLLSISAPAAGKTAVHGEWDKLAFAELFKDFHDPGKILLAILKLNEAIFRVVARVKEEDVGCVSDTRPYESFVQL